VFKISRMIILTHLDADEDFVELCHLRLHKTVLGVCWSDFAGQKWVLEAVAGAEEVGAGVAADVAAEDAAADFEVVLAAPHLVCVVLRAS
jgi:hypothetical protein